MLQTELTRTKTGLATSLSGFNPRKLPLFIAILSRGRHVSTNFTDRVIFLSIVRLENCMDASGKFLKKIKGMRSFFA
jgi:hypothetical protein